MKHVNSSRLSSLKTYQLKSYSLTENCSVSYIIMSHTRFRVNLDYVLV